MLLRETFHNKGEVALPMYEVEVEAGIDVNEVEPWNKGREIVR
jgi:hypothetical protein